MKALPTAPPVAARNGAAVPDCAGLDSGGEGGSFVAALGLACEPAAAALEAAASAASARNAESEPGEPVDAADTADATDLSALLPGWPPASAVAAPAVETIAARAIAPAAAAAQRTSALAAMTAFARGDKAGLPNQPETLRTANPAEATRRHGLDGAAPSSLALAATVPANAAPQAVAAVAAEAPCAPSLAKNDAPAAPAAAPAHWQATASIAAPGTAPMAGPAGAAASAPMPPTFEAQIAAALDSPAFAPALANQVTWLAGEGVQQARISLNPVEMGPLTVKIVLDGTQARIDFSADLAGTRSAIEASLPTLAAALHDQGLTLAGGGVFDSQARHGAQRERQAPGTNAAAAQPPAAPAGATTPLRATRGLVDLVA